MKRKNIAAIMDRRMIVTRDERDFAHDAYREPLKTIVNGPSTATTPRHRSFKRYEGAGGTHVSRPRTLYDEVAARRRESLESEAAKISAMCES